MSSRWQVLFPDDELTKYSCQNQQIHDRNWATKYTQGKPRVYLKSSFWLHFFSNNSELVCKNHLFTMFSKGYYLYEWLVVYRLRTQNLRFVAPMPEQIGTTTMHFSKVSEKCIEGVLICSGMGATNFILRPLQISDDRL